MSYTLKPLTRWSYSLPNNAMYAALGIRFVGDADGDAGSKGVGC